MAKCRLWVYNAEHSFVASGHPFAPVIRPPKRNSKKVFFGTPYSTVNDDQASVKYKYISIRNTLSFFPISFVEQFPLQISSLPHSFTYYKLLHQISSTSVITPSLSIKDKLPHQISFIAGGLQLGSEEISQF